MGFNLEKTQRTVWEVNDRITFFEQMKPLLNLDADEVSEIKEQLQCRDFDYLEVASYIFGGSDEEPDAALVFDGKKDVYWDIFNGQESKAIIGKIEDLADNKFKLSHKRGLTQRDWKKRFQAVYGVDPAEAFDAL
jgi:hypothetical protein